MPYRPNPESRKVENLRALACVLLVSYHVTGAGPDHGLYLGDGSPVRTLLDLLWPARMPLFVFLSGYVYALRPVQSWPDVRGLLRRKAARLLVPLLVLAPWFMLGQLWSRGEDASLQAILHGAYVVPQTYYWFLQALMWIFVAVSLLERCGALSTAPRTAVVFGLALALNLLQPVLPDLFGAAHALSFLPCFVAGIALHRFARELLRPRWLLAAAAAYPLYAAAIGAGLRPGDGAVAAVLCVLAGCGVCLLLFRWAPGSRVVTRLGAYSYTVFLYHQFFVTAVRKFGAGELPQLPEFLLLLAVGLAGPVLLEQLLSRNAQAAWLLLGRQRPRRADRLPAAALFSRSAAVTPRGR